ncbi:MAG: SpoIIE family protein phosphatase, partial [Clostridia bacterium]|nr:SpoIIE family protein phosphatase [Clostridia bacterium]
MEKETRALCVRGREQERKRERPLLCAIKAAAARRADRGSAVLLDLAAAGLGGLFALTHGLCGVYPFAAALLCAVGGRAPAVLLGALGGALAMGETAGLYFLFYILLFGARLALSYPRPRRRLPQSKAFFEEDPSLRVAVAGAGSVLLAVYELILVGAKSYAVLFAMASVLVTPLLTLLFCFFTASGLTLSMLLGQEGWSGKKSAFRKAPGLLLQAGALSLGFCLCFALAPVVYFGVSVGKCAAALLSFFVARRFGALRGCAMGLTVGIAAEAVYAPAFGLLGLCAGVYQSVGMPLALGAAVVAGGAFAAHTGSIEGFLAITPELTVSSLLGWGLFRKLPREDGQFWEEEASPPSPPPAEEEDVLSCLSGAFSVVSDKLRVATEEEKAPSPEEYERLCRHAKERLCRRCPARGECEENGEVESALRKAAVRLLCGEEVPSEGAPCEGYRGMVEEIRRGSTRLAKEKRQGGAKGALSVDYALLSRILRETAEERRQMTRRDTAAEEALAAALASHGIYAEEVRVMGGRVKQVTVTDLHGETGWTEDGLLQIVRDTLGRELGAARLTYDGRRAVFSAESRPRFLAVGGMATRSGKEDEPSGDRAVYIETEDHLAYALLCDGMGSGARAAGAAELCASVLSSLLSAGVRRETALSLLNNLICTGEECTVAMDLLCLDLLSGKATFLKSGAAASFVGRGSSLFRIRSRTIPMGLLRMLDAEEAGFEMRSGDTVIVLSDGVMAGAEDGGWLK